MFFQKKSINVKKTPMVKEKPSASAWINMQRIVEAFAIGKRMRYQPIYDEQMELESLVVGFRINDQYYFQQPLLNIIDDGAFPSLEINDGNETQSLKFLNHLYLVLPSDMGEERKLDYQTRVNLGRRGQFGLHQRFKLISAQGSHQNVEVESEVQRNILLHEGPHAGHQAVLQEVMLSTIKLTDNRVQPRVETHFPVTLCKNGEGAVLPAVVQDVSEFIMRVSLSSEDDRWPKLRKRDFVVVHTLAIDDQPSLTLKCECLREYGHARVLKIIQVEKQGKFVTFEMIDAMELKINLLHHGQTNSFH